MVIQKDTNPKIKIKELDFKYGYFLSDRTLPMP
jgi:hypothetical protein